MVPWSVHYSWASLYKHCPSAFLIFLEDAYFTLTSMLCHSRHAINAAEITVRKWICWDAELVVCRKGTMCLCLPSSSTILLLGSTLHISSREKIHQKGYGELGKQFIARTNSCGPRDTGHRSRQMIDSSNSMSPGEPSKFHLISVQAVGT